MTVQYEGNDVHKLMFGRKEVLLSEAEIYEIQTWNFCSMIETKSVEDLETELDNMQVDVSDLTREINKSFEKLDKLVSDDVFSEEDYDLERTKIFQIIGKLQEI